jgi:hypothetical protein
VTEEYLVEYTNYKTGDAYSFTTFDPNQLNQQIYEWSSNDPTISAEELSAAQSSIDNGVNKAVQLAKTIVSADKEVLIRIAQHQKARAIWIPLTVIVITAFVAAAIYLSRPAEPTRRPIPSVEPPDGGT